MLPKATRAQRLAMFVQFAISAGIGCLVYFGIDATPKAKLLGALVAGFGGLWLIMKAYKSLRFGGRSTLKWDGD